MIVLICGANGQLGRATSAALAGAATPLSSRELDVCDLSAVRGALKQYQPTAVINCATYTQVDDAETNQQAAYRVNALGPRNLAPATAARGIALLHVSTDYVFDGSAGRADNEFDVPCPASGYGASKLAGELAIAQLNRRHYIVRTAWLCDAVSQNFPNTMLKLSERDEVRVVADKVGSPTYAPHLADALTELLATDSFGIWHLAGAGATSWHGPTTELYAQLHISTPVIAVTTAEFPRPAARPACSILESWQLPQIQLPRWQEGLREFAATRVLT